MSPHESQVVIAVVISGIISSASAPPAGLVLGRGRFSGDKLSRLGAGALSPETSLGVGGALRREREGPAVEEHRRSA
jgi:hypothetical protein